MRFMVGPDGKRDYLAGTPDLPVIVDVLRMSSTVTVALSCGAARIIPVEDAGEALALGSKMGAILVGERHGIRIEGFYLGNSPAEMLRTPLEGRTIVITTTNGTRVMVEGGIIAGTLNAGAVAEKIAATPHTYILASGAPLKSEEDLCAAKLIELIAGKIGGGMATSAAVEAAIGSQEGTRLLDGIRHSRSGERLAAYGSPEDVEMICTQVNRYPVIPVYRNGAITLDRPLHG
jgi:2-phosphosulfolactate phosphatase